MMISSKYTRHWDHWSPVGKVLEEWERIVNRVAKAEVGEKVIVVR